MTIHKSSSNIWNVVSTESRKTVLGHWQASRRPRVFSLFEFGHVINARSWLPSFGSQVLTLVSLPIFLFLIGLLFLHLFPSLHSFICLFCLVMSLPLDCVCVCVCLTVCSCACIHPCRHMKSEDDIKLSSSITSLPYIFLNFYLFFFGVWMFCLHVKSVPRDVIFIETRRGHQVPWNWS